jgi:hypothetical protein
VKLTASVTEDEVYWKFLSNELYCFNTTSRCFLEPFLKSPKFDDLSQNAQRRNALYARREPLLAKLPAAISWQSGELQTTELAELRTIKNCGWNQLCPDNVLRNVIYPQLASNEARQKIDGLLHSVRDPGFDKTLILIGQSKSGPFTILDGNPRAVALFLNLRDGRSADGAIPIYLGLSPLMNLCLWFAGA